MTDTGLTCPEMWNEFPLDLLSHIFSFLSPQSMACAVSTCTRWRGVAATDQHLQPSWFVAMVKNTRCQGGRDDDDFCYAHNPETGRWHTIALDFLQPHSPIRFVSSVGRNLILYKLTIATSSSLRLGLCNPFTRQHKLLPELTNPRANPAVGVKVNTTSNGLITDSAFRIYVAGGSVSSYSTYEKTVEMYDPTVSGEECWRVAGGIPIEFAVRLTVWTPNESVYASAEETMYWMTSARAFSIMGFNISARTWKEVKTPIAEMLEWAALVPRRSGRLGLVGGTNTSASSSYVGQGWVWELIEDGQWAVVGTVPMEMGSSTTGGLPRCVCSHDGGVLYVFKDLCSQMLVFRDCEWRISQSPPPPPTCFRGVFLHPTVSHSHNLTL